MAVCCCATRAAPGFAILLGFWALARGARDAAAKETGASAKCAGEEEEEAALLQQQGAQATRQVAKHVAGEDEITEVTYTFRMKYNTTINDFGPIMNYDSWAPEFGGVPKLQGFCAIAKCDSEAVCHCPLYLGQGYLLGPAREFQNWLDETSGGNTLSTFAIEIAQETKKKYGKKACSGTYAFCYGAPCECKSGDCFGEKHAWNWGDEVDIMNNTAVCQCEKRTEEFDSVNINGPDACSVPDGLVPGVPRQYRP